LLCGTVSDDDLRAVQRRRQFSTRAIQAMQVLIQNRVIGRMLENRQALSPPLVFKPLPKVPFLTRIRARRVGMGFRPEQIRLPAPA